MDTTSFMDKLFSNPNIKIKDMNKGLTNQNFSLEIEGDFFVLRTPRCDSEQIVDRHHETLALQAIQGQGIDVEMIYYDEASGYKVTRYLPHALDYTQYQGSDKIERTANLMKKFHSLQKKTGVYFEPVKRYAKYKSFVKEPLYDITKYEIIFDSLPTNTATMCLCHNDWVEGNILFDGDNTYLIDYEYAGDNDPLFDVMSFITENQIHDEVQREQFYKIYFGTITPSIRKQLLLWENMHNLLWCMWAMMMWENRKEVIFKRIAQDKHKALRTSYQTLEKTK